MAVTIYLDDENPGGSSPTVLHELEWKRGAILKQ